MPPSACSAERVHLSTCWAAPAPPGSARADGHSGMGGRGWGGEGARGEGGGILGCGGACGGSCSSPALWAGRRISQLQGGVRCGVVRCGVVSVVWCGVVRLAGLTCVRGGGVMSYVVGKGGGGVCMCMRVCVGVRVCVHLHTAFWCVCGGRCVCGMCVGGERCYEVWGEWGAPAHTWAGSSQSASSASPPCPCPCPAARRRVPPRVRLL